MKTGTQLVKCTLHIERAWYFRCWDCMSVSQCWTDKTTADEMCKKHECRV
jgi:hypothetical protein